MPGKEFVSSVAFIAPTTSPLRSYYVKLTSCSFYSFFRWTVVLTSFLFILFFFLIRQSALPAFMNSLSQTQWDRMQEARFNWITALLFNYFSIHQAINFPEQFLTGFQLLELSCLFTALCSFTGSLIWSHLTLFPILRLTGWGKKITSDKKSSSPFLPSLRDAFFHFHFCQLTVSLRFKASQTWIMTLSSPMAHYSL